MVFNSPVVVGVARVSASACQYIACNPERLNSDQVLHLLFCFPFQQLRRFALCLWTFFCFPDSNLYGGYGTTTTTSSDEDDDDDDSDSPDVYDLDQQHPHSD